MKKLYIFAIICSIITVTAIYYNRADEVLSKKGSTGNEVIQIQKNLNIGDIMMVILTVFTAAKLNLLLKNFKEKMV